MTTPPLRYEALIHGHFVDIRGLRESGALYDAEGRITHVSGAKEDMDRLRRAITAHAAAAERRGWRKAIDALRDRERYKTWWWHRQNRGRLDSFNATLAADYLESIQAETESGS